MVTLHKEMSKDSTKFPPTMTKMAPKRRENREERKWEKVKVKDH